MQRSDRVDPEHAEQRVPRIDLEQRHGTRPDLRGIVDQDVDTPEAVKRGPADVLSLLPDIRDQGEHFSGTRQLLRHFAQRSLTPGDEDQPCSPAGIEPGDLSAQPPRRARDQRHPAL